MTRHDGRARRRSCVFALAALILFAPRPAAARQQMPDPRAISGKALPDASLPAGTIAVRVIRGSFSNNVPNQPVEFVVAGQPGKNRTIKTDASGRAQLDGLDPGTGVTASTVLDGVRIQSEPIVAAASGIRVALVGVDPDAAKRDAEDRALATGPAVPGLVVLGPESRTIIELDDERLALTYVFQILNTARTPVDVGGPIAFDLPTGARDAVLRDGSSKQAVVIGPRVTVTGPFAPGTTAVNVAFEMPFEGEHVSVRQRLPVALEQTTVLMVKTGALDFTSAQVGTKREVSDQGQRLLVAEGPAIASGGTFTMDISGLPHVPRWPRYLALTLAGIIVSAGIWGAVFVTPRRSRR